MVQSSGRFKTTHTGCYLSAKAYGEVRRFETALYGALFRGQSKKRHPHARPKISLKKLKCCHKRQFPSGVNNPVGLICRVVCRKASLHQCIVALLQVPSRRKKVSILYKPFFLELSRLVCQAKCFHRCLEIAKYGEAQVFQGLC